MVSFILLVSLYIYGLLSRVQLQEEVRNYSSESRDRRLNGLGHVSYLDAKKILNSFFYIQFNGLVSEIQVIPSYNNLMSLIDRKFEAEAYFNKYKIMNLKVGADKRAMIKINEGWCSSVSGTKVDGEIYYRNWLKIIENMLNFYRRLNTKKNTGNAFISFTNPFIADKIIKYKKLITNQANTFPGSY